MAGNLKKFVNPRFIKTIDLELIKTLLLRHNSEFNRFDIGQLEQDEGPARDALSDFLSGPEDAYPDGLRADLHRIAELGNSKGLEIIQTQAVRQGIDLFPDIQTSDEETPNRAHDPKHIAVRVFLEHPNLFEIAADYLAMMAADRLHEYAGRQSGIVVDITNVKVEKFRSRISEIFKGSFLGDFCRIGDYVDGGEINLVISHGSLVSTMPIVEGEREKVISIRAVSHAVLRYSEDTGILRLARIKKAHQAEIAELFAEILLERPGFFEGDDAQDLYTLDNVERAGADFSFDHRFDPEIDRVLIIEASADLMVPGKNGYPRVARSIKSRDLTGQALRHFDGASVAFGGSWRLGELVFRVLFRKEGNRQPQVTVKIRPPGIVQFRRTQHEERVMKLIERNGLLNDRSDYLVIDGAE